MSRKNEKDERTLRMMEEAATLLKEGRSVKEVAGRFGLTDRTVYNRLGEIAERAGMTREELLKCPKSGYTAPRAGTREEEKIDIEAFHKKMDLVMANLEAAREDMRRVVQFYDEFAKEMGEKR